MKNRRIDYAVLGAVFAICVFLATSVIFDDYLAYGIAYTASAYSQPPSGSIDLNRRPDIWQELFEYSHGQNCNEKQNPKQEDTFKDSPAEEEDSRREDSFVGDGGGIIERKTYSYSESSTCACLPFGGYIRNDTSEDMEYLLEQAAREPIIDVHCDSEPLVLIMHTHTTECYMEDMSTRYTSDLPQRSTDYEKTVVAVGEKIAEKLSAAGIGVIHDRTVHDYPNYNGAYDRSAETVIDYLEEYPGIRIVIDVHRDAMEADGIRYAPVAEIDGKAAAQVMIICGNLNVPQFRYNLRLAARLQGKLETEYPGLTRPLMVAERNYNQELTKGSFLLEVGSSANSLEEALYSGELVGISLAELLSELAD